MNSISHARRSTPLATPDGSNPKAQRPKDAPKLHRERARATRIFESTRMPRFAVQPQAPSDKRAFATADKARYAVRIGSPSLWRITPRAAAASTRHYPPSVTHARMMDGRDVACSTTLRAASILQEGAQSFQARGSTGQTERQAGRPCCSTQPGATAFTCK